MKKKVDKKDLSIVEAVETLSNIADLDFDADIGVTQSHKLVIQDREFEYHTVHWLAEGDVDDTITAVRNTFRVILNYLKGFYQTGRQYSEDSKTFEGIKNIMFLVGEAAKKLDRYTDLFKEHQLRSVTNLPEFKDLRKLYYNKIATEEGEQRQIDRLFHKKVSPLTPKGLKAYAQRKRLKNDPQWIFVDLDAVKKDRDYELMYLRKKEGHTFYNNRLLRNIKLVCDFEETFGKSSKKEGPFQLTGVWSDTLLNTTAQNILSVVSREMDQFYQFALKFRDRELVATLNKCLMALMLTSHKQNIRKNKPVKTCRAYFRDFQAYLREAFECAEYQKNLSYGLGKDNMIERGVMKLIHALSAGLFTQTWGLYELAPVLNKLVDKKKEKTLSPGDAVESWVSSMGDLMRKHPNGPLLKVLEAIEDKKINQFDPLVQENVPNRLFDLYIDDTKITLLRLPSPTRQSDIEKAEVLPEFKGMLWQYATGVIQKKHLLINLQDRTAWQEHARCRELEGLQDQETFSDVLTVVTLPKDTDFYHQLPPYNKTNSAKAFQEQFKEHILGDSSGFFFPKKVKQAIGKKFVDKMMTMIHKVFYGERKKLSRDERLDFIELAYVMIELKVIDVIRPDTMSLTCKDGVDTSAAANAGMFAFFQALGSSEKGESANDMIKMILLGPALLLRERNIHPGRVERLTSFLRSIDTAQKKDPRLFAENLKKGMKTLFQLPLGKARAHTRGQRKKR